MLDIREVEQANAQYPTPRFQLQIDYKTLTHQWPKFGYTSQPIWLHYHNTIQPNHYAITT